MHAWNDKLIQLVDVAPAQKPVISTYPPDSTRNWQDTIGHRICGAEFGSALIKWHIVRLNPRMQVRDTTVSESDMQTIPMHAGEGYDRV